MYAIILAGGKSSRMGQDKAFIKIDDIPIIKRQISLLKKLFKKIILVTNQPEKYRSLKGVKVISDAIPHQGPLGGIYSGLRASNSSYNFVVACDIPFLNLPLIKYMTKLKEGFDIVVPRIKRGYESLFAVYSKACLRQISPILHTRDLRVRDIFGKVKLREISEKEIRKFGDPEILFMNINTPKDLCRINTFLKEAKS